MYAAAVFTNDLMPGQTTHERRFTEEEKQIVIRQPFILESYHYVKGDRYVNAMRRNNAKVFLDSGAFSAKHSGAEINLNEYCSYIERNRDIIKVVDGQLVAAVLDVIGDADASYENQKYMEQRGINPIPVYHIYEDERWLDYYVANYPYIGIGGASGLSAKAARQWFDRLWSKHLLDGAGNPKTRVHGLAVTAVPLMERYPWFSVDSSSWVQAASFGSVWLPEEGPIKISDKSPSKHEFGKHLMSYTEIERDKILAKIRAQGFDPDRLASSPFGRFAYNLWAYPWINYFVNQKRAVGFPPLEEMLF